MKKWIRHSLVDTRAPPRRVTVLRTRALPSSGTAQFLVGCSDGLGDNLFKGHKECYPSLKRGFNEGYDDMKVGFEKPRKKENKQVCGSPQRRAASLSFENEPLLLMLAESDGGGSRADVPRV